MLLRSLVCSAVLCGTALTQSLAGQPAGQMSGMKMGKADSKKLPSPPATAETTLGGKKITIKYNAPSVRGRKIVGGEVVPYGQVWRTGANPATTLITEGNLKIGTLSVPAGTYTVYSLPDAANWMLIINKQTGQWGTVYNEGQDLGRTPLTSNPLASSQEVMSISFENAKAKSAELHIKWEKTDEFVTVTAE